MYRRLTAISCLILFIALVTSPTRLEAEAPKQRPSHHLGQGFKNLNGHYSYSMAERARKFLGRLGESETPRGTAPELFKNDGAALRANGQKATITWIGHSTFLVQIDGVNLLTDPHWGDRASPVSFAGPRRLVPPGMRFEDLPPIHAVVISHDHYDHLDLSTIARLESAHSPTFFVPLGVGELIKAMGGRTAVEMDWWESRTFKGLTIVCTPAQHSSGRTLTDQNRRLWSSWVAIGAKQRLFFAGDTGYFEGLKQIGETYGPFDVAAIPIGGYSSWEKSHPNHVNPEEAVQLLEDVRGKLLVPMHWGTFNMNREPFAEPPGRLLAEARRRGIAERVTVLRPGETVHF